MLRKRNTTDNQVLLLLITTKKKEKKNKIKFKWHSWSKKRWRKTTFRTRSIKLLDESRQFETKQSALDCEKEHTKEVENDCVEETGQERASFFDRDEKEEAATLPWHYFQLYHLFWKDSDYFSFLSWTLRSVLLSHFWLHWRLKLNTHVPDGLHCVKILKNPKGSWHKLIASYHES